MRGDIYRIDETLVPVLDEIEEVVSGRQGLFRSERLHGDGLDVNGARRSSIV